MEKRENFKRYGHLLLAFICCALGIVMTINSRIGVSPWDVLHIGLAQTTGMTIGQANILVGAAVILLNVLLHQTLGIGTVLNIIVIGLCVDLIGMWGLVPLVEGMAFKYLMFLVGMVIFSYGTFLYIVQAKGCGPRDGLMQAVNRRTGISVGIVKNSIELMALAVGWWLGGPVGWGTVIYALTIGFFIQFFFNHFQVELKNVQHDSLQRELKIWTK